MGHCLEKEIFYISQPGVKPGELVTLKSQPWRLSGAISRYYARPSDGFKAAALKVIRAISGGSSQDNWWIWGSSFEGYQEQFPKGQARPSGDFWGSSLEGYQEQFPRGQARPSGDFDASAFKIIRSNFPGLSQDI